MSENPLSSLSHQQQTASTSTSNSSSNSSSSFPVTLKHLNLSGCQLQGSLPPSLTRLTALEQLVASANSIRHADPIFACQHLLHAGLAYNHISTLVSLEQEGSTDSNSASSSSRSDGAVLASCQLMSLDLAHNDITDLPSILQQLSQLPKLRALHLRGNPVSLLPAYKSAVLQHLPQLVYLDGQVGDE